MAQAFHVYVHKPFPDNRRHKTFQEVALYTFTCTLSPSLPPQLAKFGFDLLIQRFRIVVPCTSALQPSPVNALALHWKVDIVGFRVEALNAMASAGDLDCNALRACNAK